jgi:hypothetical protein
MSTNQYHFVTNWRVPAKIEAVFDILSDPLDLPRWWSAVYLEVKELEAGDDSGIGRVIDLHTRGWLPYTLRWRFRVLEVNPPITIKIQAFGDFEGYGEWKLRQDDEMADIIYDWQVTATKPILKTFSFLFKPVFSANHHWAMRQGLSGLQTELNLT